MEKEDKMYLLKIKYSIIDVNQKKKGRKFNRKKEKLYLIADPDIAEEKLATLGDDLLERRKTSSNSFFGQLTSFMKRFGSRCNQTYYNMLRT